MMRVVTHMLFASCLCFGYWAQPVYAIGQGGLLPVPLLQGEGGGEGSKDGKEKEVSKAEASPGGAVRPTTWAVKIKSADKVSALHDLLQQLRQQPAGGEGAPASGDNAV
jgi:hypothetical protein